MIADDSPVPAGGDRRRGPRWVIPKRTTLPGTTVGQNTDGEDTAVLTAASARAVIPSTATICAVRVLVTAPNNRRSWARGIPEPGPSPYQSTSVPAA